MSLWIPGLQSAKKGKSGSQERAFQWGGTQGLMGVGGSKLNVIYRDQATEPRVSEELAAHQPPPYGGLLVPDSD